MTLPDERTRAIINAKMFMRDLISPSKTKGVPKHIRERARRILKHYPSTYELALVAEDEFGVLGPVKVEDYDV